MVPARTFSGGGGGAAVTKFVYKFKFKLFKAFSTDCPGAFWVQEYFFSNILSSFL
jgi:hypothetical protein